MILFIALVLHWLLDARPWALSAAIVALALLVQIHLAALALIPVLLVLLVAYGPVRLGPVSRTRFWMPLGAGLVISFALYAPYLLALGGSGASAVQKMTGVASGATPQALWKPALYALMNIGGLNIHALAGSERFKSFLAGILPLNYWPDRIEAALVVGGALYLAVRCWRQRTSRLVLGRDGVLLLWLVLPVLFFMLWPTEVYPHYLVPIYPAPYIALAVAVFGFGRRVIQGRGAAGESGAGAVLVDRAPGWIGTIFIAAGAWR